MTPDQNQPAPPPPGDQTQSAADQLGHGGIETETGHRLVRATQLTGRPVVTLEGDHEVEIKDVVFDKEAGGLTGFTLRKPGLLGGPQRAVLPIAGVSAIGPDAVMIRSHREFAEAAALAGSGDDVLGDQVITDEGTALGNVVDVIASVIEGTADIVGFEITATAALGSEGDHVFVPLPAALAISGEAIVVPATAADYATKDLIDFNVSVDAFRSQLESS